MKKIAVIYNVTSGIGDPLKKLRKIRELFREYQLDPAFFFAGDSGREIRREVNTALEEGFDIIVASGGDGTVGTVASQLIGKNTALAIIPNGTFNFFSKFIGVSTLEKSIETIAQGKYEFIDIGQVNGHNFLNNSTLGIHAEIVSLRKNREAQGMRKWPAYFLAAYDKLKSFHFDKSCITIQKMTLCENFSFVFIGNNEYPWKSDKQDIRDGKLNILIIPSTDPIGLFQYFFKLVFGRLRPKKDFYYYQSSEITIERRKEKIKVGLDGEILELSNPLRYKILPKALRVIFPAIS